MTKTVTLILVAAALAFNPGDMARSPWVETVGAEAGRAFTWDVAMDGRTWRMDNNTFDLDSPDVNDNPFGAPPTGAILRGNTFIVSGTIFRGGTLPTGGTFADPSPIGPDTAGRIGRWVCRGTFNFDGAEIATGSVPHVTSTQFFYLDDGRMLVTDGPEGGTVTLRAILGGAGAFAGAAGQVVEEPIGVNHSNLFNVRFTFNLLKTAPR